MRRAANSHPTTKELEMTTEYKIGLPPVSDDIATGAAKEIIDGTKKSLGLTANMYRTTAN